MIYIIFNILNKRKYIKEKKKKLLKYLQVSINCCTFALELRKKL